MAAYQLALLLFCAIFVQNFANAIENEDEGEEYPVPYTFEELVENNLLDVSSNVTVPIVSDDPKLALDYHFDSSEDENEVFEVNERDEQWNDDMLVAKNRVKELRIKQRERYLLMKELESESDEIWKNKVQNLKELIADDDESVQYWFAIITDLENERKKDATTESH